MYGFNVNRHASLQRRIHLAGGGGAVYLAEDLNIDYVYSQLRHSSATTTAARYRRSSDNAELPFTPEEITGGALLSWIGGNDGFIVSFANQGIAGIKTATQSNILNQARGVTAGVLEVDTDGNPSADYFIGGNPSYYDAGAVTVSQPFTGWASAVFDNAANNGTMLLLSNSLLDNDRRMLRQQSTSIFSRFGVNQVTSIPFAINTKYICYCMANGASSIHGANGSSTAISPGTNGATGLIFGQKSADAHDGHLTTVIFTSGNRNADRVAIEAYL